MSELEAKYSSYPATVSPIINNLRREFINTASDLNLTVSQTLKWGEPSFMVKGGSTVRIDWKNKLPDKIGIYFNCNSRLVETFKELYPTTFDYQGNRAILLNVNMPIAMTELKHCIRLAFSYHQNKHLPLLGA